MASAISVTGGTTAGFGDGADRRSLRVAAPTRPALAQAFAARESGRFYDGFERPRAAGWDVAVNERSAAAISSWPSRGPVSRVRGNSRDGDHKLRFGVEPRPTSFRSEVKRPTVPMGSDYWYGFSLNVPKEWQRDPDGSILAQWHARVDQYADRYNYPVVSLYLVDDTWQVRLNWNTLGDTSQGAGWGRATFRLGAARKGVWTDWVVHARWSHGSDGLLEVWRDGKSVVRYQGPNEYVNKSGPYFKMGIYHPAWRSAGARIRPKTIPLVTYADDVRFARNGSYEAVRPR